MEDHLNDPHCGLCEHFIGGGDWSLCCDLPHPEAPWGFLCYEDTPACESYEPCTDYEGVN